MLLSELNFGSFALLRFVLLPLSTEDFLYDVFFRFLDSVVYEGLCHLPLSDESFSDFFLPGLGFLQCLILEELLSLDTSLCYVFHFAEPKIYFV